MNTFVSKFSQLNRRDQAALLICGIVVGIYLLWALLLNPLAEKRATQLQNNTAASLSLGRVKMLTAQLEQSRQQERVNPNTATNISQLVYSSLQENGITLSQFQPGTAGEARIRIDRTPYEPLMQWLYEIEFKHQVTIRELSIGGSNDPGLVTVNIRLQKH